MTKDLLELVDWRDDFNNRIEEWSNLLNFPALQEQQNYDAKMPNQCSKKTKVFILDTLDRLAQPKQRKFKSKKSNDQRKIICKMHSVQTFGHSTAILTIPLLPKLKGKNRKTKK